MQLNWWSLGPCRGQRLSSRVRAWGRALPSAVPPHCPGYETKTCVTRRGVPRLIHASMRTAHGEAAHECTHCGGRLCWAVWAYAAPAVHADGGEAPHAHTHTHTHGLPEATAATAYAVRHRQARTHRGIRPLPPAAALPTCLPTTMPARSSWRHCARALHIMVRTPQLAAKPRFPPPHRTAGPARQPRAGRLGT